VSELLRERLGPTSEYASSLISIQAAYINTNHPEFVAGSAAIAREGAKPAPPKEPSLASTPDDEEASSSEEEAGSAPSGPPALPARHPRSSSTSTPDARKPQPRQLLNEKHIHHRASSNGQAPKSHTNSLLPPSTLSGTSPHTAKDSFLNYFFGGPNGTGPGGPGGPGVGQNSHHQGQRNDTSHGQREQQNQRPTSGRQPPAGFTQRDVLPDLGRRTASRSGLEGGTTAFDMKSLGKHLDAVSLGSVLVLC
jgi:dynamin 1-like protein